MLQPIKIWLAEIVPPLVSGSSGGIVQKSFDCSVDTELLTGMRLAKVSLGRTELVVIPTDTVYGIAANAFSCRSCSRFARCQG